MKRKVVLIAGIIALLALSVFPVSAYSHYYYFFNHGCTAVAEETNAANVNNMTHIGWGLQLRPVTGTEGTWIHLPITNIASIDGVHPGVRYMFFKWYGEDFYINITDIDVYNGDTKIFTQDLALKGNGAWQERTIDLGSYRDFQRGGNIAIHVKNDWPLAYIPGFTPDMRRWFKVAGYGIKMEY